MLSYVSGQTRGSFLRTGQRCPDLVPVLLGLGLAHVSYTTYSSAGARALWQLGASLSSLSLPSDLFTSTPTLHSGHSSWSSPLLLFAPRTRFPSPPASTMSRSDLPTHFPLASCHVNGKQTEQDLSEHKQQAKLIFRRIGPNSEPRCTIESGQYNLQCVQSHQLSRLAYAHVVLATS